MIDPQVIIPGDFDGTEWIVDGRVLDPLARANGDYSEIEVVGVRFRIGNNSIEFPLRNISDDDHIFFSDCLNTKYLGDEAELDLVLRYDRSREGM